MSRFLHVGVALGLSATVWLSAVTAGAAEPDKLLPADATAVVVINVKQTLESPFGKKYLAELFRAGLQQSPEAQKVLAATGVDPLKDVTTVVAATTGTDTDKALLIVHGSFDPAKAGAAAEEYAKKNPTLLKIHKEGDAILYENKTDNSVFGAFVDKTTVVLSPSKSVVVDALKSGGKSPAKLKKEFLALIEKADAKQAIWLAGVTPDEVRKMLAAQENTKDIADKVNGVVGAVAVEKDLQATISIVTSDAKAAEAVADLLSGFKDLAKLMIRSNKEFGKSLLPVVESLKIGTSKSDVTLSARVSEEVIEKLTKQVPAKPEKKP